MNTQTIIKFKSEINDIIDECIKNSTDPTISNNSKYKLLTHTVTYFGRMKQLYLNQQSDDDDDIDIYNNDSGLSDDSNEEYTDLMKNRTFTNNNNNININTNNNINSKINKDVIEDEYEKEIQKRLFSFGGNSLLYNDTNEDYVYGNDESNDLINYDMTLFNDEDSKAPIQENTEYNKSIKNQEIIKNDNNNNPKNFDSPIINNKKNSLKIFVHDDDIDIDILNENNIDYDEPHFES